MKIKWVTFGEIEVEGQRYREDIVIEKGEIRKRLKSASKPHRDRLGHTPLSVAEEIPWHGERLYVGTGTYGRLPILDDVYEAAGRRGVAVVAKPTAEICGLLATCDAADVNAILHVTC